MLNPSQRELLAKGDMKLYKKVEDEGPTTAAQLYAFVLSFLRSYA